ncbi:MAG: nitroreductase [Elusimicrobia bacterium CG08_land_8_20_14_0_20_51_18]|nr:MAG: nitroreductase [Elusimicrobia bacterium CG08_land_8_20_14_0_20_51_18]
MNRSKIIRLMQGYHLNERGKKSDQEKGVPAPAAEKSINSSPLIKLPDPLKVKLKKSSVTKCLLDRRSTRQFPDSPVSTGELSYLLWAAQGIRKQKEPSLAHHIVKRTVPSAGSRHPFETYLIAQNVKGLKKGIYRYVGSKNSLAVVRAGPVSQAEVTKVACGQIFCGKAPVLFVWTAIPYRNEWRYGIEHAGKAVLMDAGHAGQNLHTACEALGLGTCMIGAYFQELADEMLKADGKDEFTVYMAPVGRLKK